MHAIHTELSVAESKGSLHQTSLELDVPDPELEHGLAAIKENTILKTGVCTPRDCVQTSDISQKNSPSCSM